MDKKEQLWLTLFCTLPVAFLWPLGQQLAEPGVTRTLVSGVLGGLGAIIGFGLYYWLKNKSTKLKVIGLISILVLGIASMSVVIQMTKPVLNTCEICGYKAVDLKEGDCQYCGNPNWENLSYKNEYSDKYDWILEEQLFWFADEDTSKINFFEPSSDDGFEKDLEWKPSVTKLDIFEDNQE